MSGTWPCHELPARLRQGRGPAKPTTTTTKRCGSISMSVIEIRALENDPKVRGIGGTSVPPAAPALANAIFAATGKRMPRNAVQQVH